MKLPIVRLISGLGLVLAVMASGAMARSPWIIVPLSGIFSVAYVLGKWPAWRAHYAQSTVAKITSEIAATLLIQTILVGIFYLLGRGGAAMFGHMTNQPFLLWDVYYCLAVTLFAFASAGWVIWREQISANRHRSDIPSDQPNHVTEPAINAEISLLAKPVTVQSFFRNIHYTHKDQHNPEKTSANSAGSDAKISTVELRLGISLPEGLKAIYRHQNGGSINNICVPKFSISEPKLFNEIITPFSGYNDLAPTESLRTLHESICDYADADDPDQADSFPQGCEKMLILAQWYRKTLFLDYSESATASVGFVDFDHDDWQAACVRWDSFEAFFSALRHFETL